jgi:hypothetical protein
MHSVPFPYMLYVPPILSGLIWSLLANTQERRLTDCHYFPPGMAVEPTKSVCNYYVSGYPSSCFYLKQHYGDTTQTPKRCVLHYKRRVHNVQRDNNYINIPSSQTFVSYFHKKFVSVYSTV